MSWLYITGGFVAVGASLWIGFILGKRTKVEQKNVGIAAASVAVLGPCIAKALESQVQWPAVVTVAILVLAVVVVVAMAIRKGTPVTRDPGLDIAIGTQDAPVNTWAEIMRDPSPSAPTYMRYVLVQYRKLVDALRQQVVDLEEAIGAYDPDVGLKEAQHWAKQGKEIRGTIRGIVTTLRAMRASAAK